MNETHPCVVLFDFDGTLADTSLGIYRAFQCACESVNLKPPTLEDFSSAIGPPVRQLFEKFFPDTSAQNSENLVRQFRIHYDTNFYRLCHWYKGVIEYIPILAQETTGLGIVTNKPTSPTRLLLQETGLLNYFTLVTGIDVRGPDKSFPDKAAALAWSLNQLRTDASLAIYCGDTPSDKDACTHLGLPFLAVGYGFHRWATDSHLTVSSDYSATSAYPLPGQPMQSFEEALSQLLSYCRKARQTS